METRLLTNALEQRVQQCLSQIAGIAKYDLTVWCRLRTRPVATRSSFEIRIKNIIPSQELPNVDWARNLYKILRRFPGEAYCLKIMFDAPKAAWTTERYAHGYNYNLGNYNLPPTPQVWGNLISHGGLHVRLEGEFEAPELVSNELISVEWHYKGL